MAVVQAIYSEGIIEVLEVRWADINLSTVESDDLGKGDTDVDDGKEDASKPGICGEFC